MDARPRILCIIGSGEAAPSMVSLHKELMALAGSPPAEAITLDTPYAFEDNAEGITARHVEYFATNVGHPIQPVSITEANPARRVELERALNQVRDAAYIFAGPGSPSYALRQWGATVIPDLLREKLTSGGCLDFASAAAISLGRFTLPVYEIYKVGETPHWLDGLDVMSVLGLDVAVLTHYDNEEGGSHDTRYCYMGARRLEELERQLPAGTTILGVAEHTAAVIDVAADTLTVRGRGFVALRREGGEEQFARGEVVPLERIRGLRPASRRPAAGLETQPAPAEPVRRFAEALAAADTASLLASALEVEEELFAAVDGDDGLTRLRGEFRAMLARLCNAADAGLRDPREAIAPFIELALRLREDAREDGRFDAADAIRDELVASGVEVRDTGAGTEWSLADGGPPTALSSSPAPGGHVPSD